MIATAPARYGDPNGRWARRGVGGGGTLVVLAVLIVSWWYSGVAVPHRREAEHAPLRIVNVRPDPPPIRRPPPRVAASRSRPPPGGHAAGRRTIAPARASQPQVAAVDPVETTRQPVAPPAPVALPETLPVTDLASAGASGLAALGMGTDAGMGEGTGHGPGDGPGIGPGRYTRSDWVTKPDSMALAPYWPSTGRGPHRPGHSALACRVRLSTRVHDCRILSEKPADAGFGAASLAASRIFRVRPPRRNGVPIDDAWVYVSIEWVVTRR